jgi:protein SCO1/2
VSISRRKIILWTGGAVALAAGGVAAYATLSPSPAQFQAHDITGAPWGRGFELTDHNGKTRRLEDFRGKVVLLFFGYTGCPDMCPTTLALLASAMKDLGADAGKVQGLFVTVDPKRDTPQLLAQYVPAFYPTFLGLYADAETTERTVREFKGYFHANPPNESGAYTVDHSAQVYVFDTAGRLRLFLQPPESTPEAVAHDVRILLREDDA